MLYRFLFPVRPEGREDVAVIVGGEGYFRRIADVARVAEVGRIRAMADVFPDPLGVGSRFSLMLAIFGELVVRSVF